MISVLFDTNIILDVALNREPFIHEAERLFSMVDDGQITGFITASTLTDIYYIYKKTNGHYDAITFISQLLEIFEVAGIDKNVLLMAISFEFKDFEDAIQSAAANSVEAEIIITRNKADFVKSNVPAYTPTEFLIGFR